VISAFRLVYVCNSALPTELFLSERFRYPFGFNITVTPQPSCKVSQPEKNAGAELHLLALFVCGIKFL
jgi:hypothetical protein